MFKEWIVRRRLRRLLRTAPGGYETLRDHLENMGYAIMPCRRESGATADAAERRGLLREVLTRASLALSASHNLTVTDRPDLPRGQWPVYVLDHRAELDLIDRALALLDSRQQR